MINYNLPTSVFIDDVEYLIRNKGDYRVILDVLSVLEDTDIKSDDDKVRTMLYIFYENTPDNYTKAIDEMFTFIRCGEAEDKSQEEPIMSWDKDFHLLISPINKVLNIEIRAIDYLHWYTFISAYMEIGECTFSNVINIRQKQRKGQKLAEYEKEFYLKNKDMVDLKSKFTNEEQDFINQIFKGGG